MATFICWQLNTREVNYSIVFISTLYRMIKSNLSALPLTWTCTILQNQTEGFN